MAVDMQLGDLESGEFANLDQLLSGMSRASYSNDQMQLPHVKAFRASPLTPVQAILITTKAPSLVKQN